MGSAPNVRLLSETSKFEQQFVTPSIHEVMKQLESVCADYRFVPESLHVHINHVERHIGAIDPSEVKGYLTTIEGYIYCRGELHPDDRSPLPSEADQNDA